MWQYLGRPRAPAGQTHLPAPLPDHLSSMHGDSVVQGPLGIPSRPFSLLQASPGSARCFSTELGTQLSQGFDSSWFAPRAGCASLYKAAGDSAEGEPKEADAWLNCCDQRRDGRWRNRPVLSRHWGTPRPFLNHTLHPGRMESTRAHCLVQRPATSRHCEEVSIQTAISNRGWNSGLIPPLSVWFSVWDEMALRKLQSGTEI